MSLEKKAFSRGERCKTCVGTGEAATEYGVVDCPDCGGFGTLPPRNERTVWRVSDIERAIEAGRPIEAEHVRWALNELRAARGALREIISLAHDTADTDSIGLRIRFTANRALGLYDPTPAPKTEHMDS